MPRLPGLSSSRPCSFRDCGCGKATSFDDSLPRNPPSSHNGRTVCGLVAACVSVNKVGSTLLSQPHEAGPEFEAIQMNASERIDQLIAGITDWRGKTLASLRKTILAADREIIEEWKWMGSPVWSHHGIISVGNAHKDKVKLTFSNGASLPDPDNLFNAVLGGHTSRATHLFQ